MKKKIKKYLDKNMKKLIIKMEIQKYIYIIMMTI
jgi:hypothetical protein